MSATSRKNILFDLVYTSKRILREEGIGSLVKRSLKRLLRRPALRWQYVIALDFTQPLPPPANKIPVDSEELQPEDFDQVVALHESRNISAETLRARLERGEICCVVKVEGQIVSLFWIQPHQAYSERLDFHYPLSPAEIYLYDSYTHPDFRGKGLSTAVTGKVLQSLKAQGYRWMIGFVVPTNQPAKRAVKKRAFQMVGLTGYVELFGVRLYFRRCKSVLKQCPALLLRKV